MNPTWADRLERRLGFLSIPGLAGFLAGMNAAVGLLSVLRPDFSFQLSLDPELVRSGQLWRLLTFLFIPPELSPLWLFFWLVLYYAYLHMLENAWGDFKLTLFCAIGAAATGLASLLLGLPLSNAAFNTSLFLAFARLNPEFEILLFFFLPVKMRWLAACAWALTALSLLAGSAAIRVSLLAGIANYLLFFGEDHWLDLKLAWHRWRNRGRY